MAAIVPVPDTPKLAPVPTNIAAVVLVPPVTELNAAELPPHKEVMSAFNFPNASHAASPVPVFDGPDTVVHGVEGAQLTSDCASTPTDAAMSNTKPSSFFIV